MNLRDYIEVVPEKRSGKPCLKGTRITVQDVLEYLASGMPESKIVEDFPELTLLHVRAALQFAATRENARLPHRKKLSDGLFTT